MFNTAPTIIPDTKTIKVGPSGTDVSHSRTIRFNRCSNSCAADIFTYQTSKNSTMTSASLDEVWMDAPFDVPDAEPPVSARVETAEPPVYAPVETAEDRLRIETAERVSMVMILAMGALAVTLLHVERLRREVRLLREAVLRPL